MSNTFGGIWTYRSFLNNPVPLGDDPKKLEALLLRVCGPSRIRRRPFSKGN